MCHSVSSDGKGPEEMLGAGMAVGTRRLPSAYPRACSLPLRPFLPRRDPESARAVGAPARLDTTLDLINRPGNGAPILIRTCMAKPPPVLTSR
ncbi:hypothetical protein CS0771_59870 [Catellatospora sp. IY07-71]|nr:hypothetical protein CS0771_59870 [Catellatospora sp. IY07-71]